MPAAKSQNRLGTYITSSVSGESVRAYIPPPLPPVPALKLEGLFQRLDRANQGLGRLNGMTKLLPDIRFLLYLYVRKEALVHRRSKGLSPRLLTCFCLRTRRRPTFPPRT